MPRHAAYYRLKPRNGLWQARFTRNKKEHRISTGVAAGDKAGARKKAEAIVLEHDTGRECELCGGGGAAPVGGATLAQLSEGWLKQLLRTHGEQFQKRATTDMVHYIEPKWSHPAEITSRAWEAYKVELHTTPTLERRARLSWGSLANLGNTLRAFLRYCADLGAIESVPEIKSPTEKQKRKDRPVLRAMDADQREAFLWALALMNEERALHVYTALFETWMRKGALAAMTPRWVNFHGETITIPSAFTKSGNGDKEIDLTPRAAEAIRAELGDPVQLDEPIFGRFDFHQAWESRGGGVFGRALTMAGIDRDGFTPHHSTRRTAATIGGGKPGASVNALKTQGAWDSASMLDRYMKTDIKAARRITR